MTEKKTGVMIVVPTYWTWPTEQAGRPVEALYDHPTPLDGESTLPRLLESLAELAGLPFMVLILTAASHPEIEAAAEGRVERLIRPFRDHFPIIQATEADAAFIRRRHRALAGSVRMRGYAGVRNLQLLLPHVLQTDVIVALDDDEVVSADYLETAVHFVGGSHRGQRVLGLAGFYLDAQGSLMLPERPRTGNPFLDKSAIMNAGLRALRASPQRLVETPVAFGGNMVFHRELFTRVGFDPGITRGEDIDYLINARLIGIRFWLDRELVITHLPPHRYDTHPYLKMIEDIHRFIYEREKLRLHAGAEGPTLSAADLMPYPGRLLLDDLDDQARAALETLATPELIRAHGAPAQIVAQALKRARLAAPAYLQFAETWPRLMKAVGEDCALKERLASRFAQA